MKNPRLIELNSKQTKETAKLGILGFAVFACGLWFWICLIGTPSSEFTTKSLAGVIVSMVLGGFAIRGMIKAIPGYSDAQYEYLKLKRELKGKAVPKQVSKNSYTASSITCILAILVFVHIVGCSIARHTHESVYYSDCSFTHLHVRLDSHIHPLDYELPQEYTNCINRERNSY